MTIFHHVTPHDYSLTFCSKIGYCLLLVIYTQLWNFTHSFLSVYPLLISIHLLILHWSQFLGKIVLSPLEVCKFLLFPSSPDNFIQISLLTFSWLSKNGKITNKLNSPMPLAWLCCSSKIFNPLSFIIKYNHIYGYPQTLNYICW